MRSFIVDQAYANDYVTPHEFNAETADLVDTYHGLDRDNVPDGTLTSAKVALDAWNVFEYSPRTTTRTTEHGESQSKGTVHEVPDTAGTATWSLRITTTDGLLEVGASVATFKSAPAAPSISNVALGVRVDGEIVAWSPMDVTAVRGCPLVDGCVFVGPGEHLVEAVFTHHSDGTAGVVETLDWLAGVLWARGVLR